MIPSRRKEDSIEQETSPLQPTLNLYLALPHADVPKRPPSWLARRLGLDLYSDVLLGKSARTEMGFAAVILVIVSLFELIAWFFLFNAIFNSDLLGTGWPTIPAILVASLFAAAVFWFERQFLTTDEDQRRRARGAAVVRVIFILTAAFITAQPLELLFFRVPVQKRIHEEGIREEAVSKLAALLKEGEQVSTAIKGQSDLWGNLYQGAQTQVTALVGQQASLAVKMRQRNGELAAARRAASGYQVERASAETPEKRRSADRSYAKAEAAAAALSREIGQIQLSIAEVDAMLGELRNRATGAVGKQVDLTISSMVNDTGRDRRLRNWIDQLKGSKPGEPVEEKWKIAPIVNKAGARSLWDEKWPSYKDREYDFFEQIHVVWDLVAGRPPRWLNAPANLRLKLENEYGFASLDQGRRGWQWHLLAAVVACHLIAIFIPFLVLTIKLFLMPKALRTYYSSRHQAEAGDPDAWLAQVVDEKVKGN